MRAGNSDLFSGNATLFGSQLRDQWCERGVELSYRGHPIFTNIFAEDTIATSAYNSLQTMLEKRFSHGSAVSGGLHL